MPLFSEALRDSKLFSLPPNSVGRRIKSKYVPHQQILVAPSASAHRRNWGLKFPVAGPKTKYTQFSKFEDEFSTNGVDVRPYFHKNIANLEHIGTPVTLNRNQRLNSLYEMPQNSRKFKGLQFMDKSEFASKLKQARQMQLQGDLSPDQALQQMGVVSGLSPVRGRLSGSTIPPQWQNSSIGASYASPSVLHNTPHGIFSRKTVPARAVPMPYRQGAVAFGGFLGTNQSSSVRGQQFNKTQNMSAQQVNGSPSGDLHISVNAETASKNTLADGSELSAASFLDKHMNAM